MSYDASADDARRPVTVTAGVAAGFITAVLIVLRGLLALVHPASVVTTFEGEQHAMNVGITIGASVGMVMAVVVGVAMTVAGVRALRGSHGWRVALAALAAWQGAAGVAGLVLRNVTQAGIRSLDHNAPQVHVTQPNAALIVTIAVLAGACTLLLFLPATNGWYRTQRAAAAPVAAPAGWYPVEDSTLRWWDGSAWTEHTHDTAPAASQADQQEPGPHE